MLTKQKKTAAGKGNRILITVNFLGSAGPMRFVVYEEQLVGDVIDMALKSYAREGRLPLLGSTTTDFLLYSPAAGSDALRPWEAIRAHGARNFTLCKKLQPAKDMEAAAGMVPESSSPATNAVVEKKGSGSWKAWINKSLAFKIASH